MIRRIVLENFMSHRHTVVEPAPGVTVITGPNNCGKSALVEALRCLVDNERGKWFIRHGAERTAVTLVVEDAGKPHQIVWNVNRNSGGWYSIDGNEHPRLQGRTPEGFDLIHRLRQEEGQDIHLSRQKYPMFLLDAGAGVVAKFFSSATDVSLFLRMTQQLAYEKRKANERLGELSIQIQATDKRVGSLSKAPELEVRLQDARRMHNDLVERQSKSQSLRDRLPKLEEAEIRIERGGDVSQAMLNLTSPPLLAPTEAMASALRSWRSAQSDRGYRKRRVSALESLAEPPPFAPTAELSSRLQILRKGARVVASRSAKGRALEALGPLPSQVETSRLAHLIDQLRREKDRLIEAGQKEEAIRKEMGDARQRLVLALEAHPTCPLCGASLTAEHLLEAAHARV